MAVLRSPRAVYGEGTKENSYPGRVRATGVGVVYKRDIARGFYVAVHAIPFALEFQDEDFERIGTGFQLFNTYRVGYEARLFDGRVFVQPNIAVTHWPIQTGLPESFHAQEAGWPNVFPLEPGLHVGVRF